MKGNRARAARPYEARSVCRGAQRAPSAAFREGAR
jgi:hypothetical protein